MLLGTEADLGPGHIVLDGDPDPPRERGTAVPLFGPCPLWPRSPISATAELSFLGGCKSLLLPSRCVFPLVSRAPSPPTTALNSAYNVAKIIAGSQASSSGCAAPTERISLDAVASMK